MRAYDLIQKKKEGKALSKEEIGFLVHGFTCGDIPDYQMSAFLMAVCFQGMTDEETTDMTLAMAYSGETADLSSLGALSADKHSSGGVADTTTPIVAPLAAALGVKVAKMSGRGLGHTGGTVDKLEAIPGYQTSMPLAQFMEQTQKLGVCVIGQTQNLAPADKKLYALRDVTATVDSIPLIAASIMSKKIASGAQNIVLDVKVGAGAFMKTKEDAEQLARLMVSIGKLANRNTAAFLTDMDIPLGLAVGNSIEISEAMAVLKNEKQGPLKTLSVALAAQMASLAFGKKYEDCLIEAEEALSSGKAFSVAKQWIRAQGGDISCLTDESRFKQPKFVCEVKAEKCGFIHAIHAEQIGIAACGLGTGRMKKEDTIDPSAGIVLKKTVGDFVSCGGVLAVLYTDKEEQIKEAKRKVLDAFSFADQEPEKRDLIMKVIR